MKKRNPKIKKSAERTPRNNSPGEGKREGTARLVTLAVAFGLVLAVFSGRLVQMQLFNADAYRQEADLQSARTVSIKAPRGEIYDRYGRPLAVNRDGYAVVLDAAYLQASQTNETILRLCGLLKEKKEEWRDDLPISEAAPYTYMPDAEENTLSALQRVLGLNHYATAQNCVDEMIRRYKLEGYSAADQRTLMGVRYTMEALDYSVSLPYTFAEDISVETRAKIMEASFDFTGVNIEIQSVREYVATDIAPHIIGTIGPIYAEDWEELKKKGYSYNDMVGKSGAESAFEDLLRGTDGEKKIIQDQSGKVIQDVVVKEPVPGSSIMLTLDSSLQGVAQASLEEIIQSLRARENAVPATGGAVVVEKVNTGEILAAANYPTFEGLSNQLRAAGQGSWQPSVRPGVSGNLPSWFHLQAGHRVHRIANGGHRRKQHGLLPAAVPLLRPGVHLLGVPRIGKRHHRPGSILQYFLLRCRQAVRDRRDEQLLPAVRLRGENRRGSGRKPGHHGLPRPDEGRRGHVDRGKGSPVCHRPVGQCLHALAAVQLYRGHRQWRDAVRDASFV